MNLFLKKKKPSLVEHRQEIKEGKISKYNKNLKNIEIQKLFTLNTGLYFKIKENDTSIYINILIDKRIIGIDDTKKKSQIPGILIFLLVLDSNYPDEPPKFITKSNFTSPSLMDGRDLFNEICPNYSPKIKLSEMIKNIIPFCARVINNRTYQFYGTFHIDSIYDLKIFENMIASKFYYI